MSALQGGPFGAGGAQRLGYESSANSRTLAQFFNAVYAWMAVGLAVTGVVAWVVAHNLNILSQILHPGTMIVLIIAELGLVWVISAAVQKINAAMATALFILYAALNGLTLSIVFLIYTQQTIAAAFLTTGLTFGVVSVYGMITKRDLSGLGGMLFMALIGLIIASVVNVFWANSTLYWLITYAGVLIFVGLTAYDTQTLRSVAISTSGDAAMSARMSVVGALALYLDFINIFLYMLRIMGNRRN